MIEVTSIPLILLGASSLMAAFAYYALKYREFMKEQAARHNSFN